MQAVVLVLQQDHFRDLTDIQKWAHVCLGNLVTEGTDLFARVLLWGKGSRRVYQAHCFSPSLTTICP